MNIQKQTKLSLEEYQNVICSMQLALEEVPEAFANGLSFKIAHGDSELLPLKHTFTDTMYLREIFMPKGTIVVGKIHKHEHPNFILKGKVLVLTPKNGIEFLEAPLSLLSPAGTKRVVFVLEECVWVCVHNNPNGYKEMCKELEDEIIAKTFKELEG